MKYVKNCCVGYCKKKAALWRGIVFSKELGKHLVAGWCSEDHLTAVANTYCKRHSYERGFCVGEISYEDGMMYENSRFGG